MKTITIALFAVLTIVGNTWGETKEPPKKGGPEKIVEKSKIEKIKVDLGGGVQMEMTLIPAGEFQMGGEESAAATAAFFNKTFDTDYFSPVLFEDDHPQHPVRITKPFYLGTYHVTRGQFRQFVADIHYKTDSEKAEKPGSLGFNPDTKKFEWNDKYSWRNAGFEQSEDHPVLNVSWNDAVAFCAWLSKKEGKTYRLPTEAEWEYSCRAGTATRYNSGDDTETLAQVGNVADAALTAKFPAAKSSRVRFFIKSNDGYCFTAPVGKFKPNIFGLYDMHGNAWQWCADWYDSEYYSKSPVDDPTGPNSGTVRVIRGGCWGLGPECARSATRRLVTAASGDSNLGFRVARTQ